MSKVIRTGRALLSAVLAFGSVSLFPVAAQGIAQGSGTFTDKRDGRKYKTVVIAGKTWMAENLNYKPKTGDSWCYEDDTSYCGKYGRLYDWKTANTACPAGWHLPSGKEWDILGRTVGGNKWRGRRALYSGFDWHGAGRALKAKSGWSDGWSNYYDKKSGNGDDAYGFSALPGGYRGDDPYNAAGLEGYWWTSTRYKNNRVHRWTFTGYKNNRVQCLNMDSGNDDLIVEDRFTIYAGLSVRCLKDERKYAVTLLNAGKNAKGGGNYVFGEEINVTAGTVPYKKFSHWTTVSGGDAFYDTGSATISFIMPANDVTLKANYDTIIATPGTFTDARDGKTYRTITVGGQKWTAENFNYTTDSSWCYNDSDYYCDKYGRLYSWNAAVNVCNGFGDGWRLPDTADWNSLENAVGLPREVGIRLRTKTDWGRYTLWGLKLTVGTDDFGFSALPGGYRRLDGRFDEVGIDGHWWSVTESYGRCCGCVTEESSGRPVAFIRSMGYYSEVVSQLSGNKSAGYSVRCVMSEGR